MTQDFKDWVREVKIAMIDNGDMTQAELAQKIKVKPPVISDLFNYGKGSEKVKRKINACLGIKR